MAVGLPGLVQACGAFAAGGGVMVCVAFAGVAVFLSIFDFGSVLVGVAIGFGHLAMVTCVSPGFGCAHCALFGSLFGLAVVGDLGLVALGLVCA